MQPPRSRSEIEIPPTLTLPRPLAGVPIAAEGKCNGSSGATGTPGGGDIRDARSSQGTLPGITAILDRKGAILLITLLFLLLLTILGTSSLYLAYSEAVVAKSIEADARAFYRAESGIAQGLYWFIHPDKFPGLPEDFFRKRMIDRTSFFDESGVSQYRGTPQGPDLTYSTGEYALKVYGPSVPGALCTMESTGISGRIRRVVTVVLYEDETAVRVLRGSWRVD